MKRPGTERPSRSGSAVSTDVSEKQNQQSTTVTPTTSRAKRPKTSNARSPPTITITRTIADATTSSPMFTPSALSSPLALLSDLTSVIRRYGLNVGALLSPSRWSSSDEEVHPPPALPSKGRSRASSDSGASATCETCALLSDRLVVTTQKYIKYKQLARHLLDDAQHVQFVVDELHTARKHALDLQLELEVMRGRLAAVSPAFSRSRGSSPLPEARRPSSPAQASAMVSATGTTSIPSSTVRKKAIPAQRGSKEDRDSAAATLVPAGTSRGSARR